MIGVMGVHTSILKWRKLVGGDYTYIILKHLGKYIYTLGENLLDKVFKFNCGRWKKDFFEDR